MPVPVQPNTSASGGYVLPTAALPAPLEDDQLTDLFQAWVVGVTGLQATLVFPRWQEEPPNLPAYGESWAAIGITGRDPDTYAALVHQGAGQGSDRFQRHEQLDLLVSFYGPQADALCGLFRDGVQVAQNRAMLTANAMGLTNTGRPQHAPALIKMRWTNRVDLPLRVNRGVQRDYPIKNLVKFQAAISADVQAAEPVVANAASPLPNQGEPA